MVGSISLADAMLSEISAHALGIRLTAPEQTCPRLLIDIGGQGSKIISLGADGTVLNFTMNDKCAAGTGKFLGVVAELLETSVEEIPSLVQRSAAPCQINSTCAVFAQTDVISLLAQKKDRSDILAGIHIAMASRIAKMARKYKSAGDVLMTGGGANNEALRMALEDELLCDVPPDIPNSMAPLGPHWLGVSI